MISSTCSTASSQLKNQLLAAWDKTVTEEPPGEKQIDYHEDSDQWVPRGDVLRCIIDDGGPEGEVTIHIDDKELSLAEFGRMLRVHAGWGMRIAFVPEEFISENPKVEIRKPREERAMATGTVKWFNATKGFGFIQPDAGGADVFVHISAVERAGMRDLNEGQKIAYEVVADRRTGKSSADNLKPA